jgi:hypothetical protein
MRNYFYKIFLFILLLLISFLFTSQSVYAANENSNLPVVTVINPIRGNEWHNKINLLSSLKEQWKAIQNEKVNATWIWQYTALEDENLVSFAKNNMKNQEFGLFLEIDRNTTKKANVQYRGQGPLYFSDGLFLVSYDKEERKKLIDEIFAKFKKTFGYYPKTVGAWWIGGDSLTYMQEKYGIVAAMKAADQFDLDVYSIWGSPWSIPYIASKNNEGIPASSFDDSSKVVIIQWAPRDPLSGYADAKFSLQDFSIQDYPFSYTDYISSIYLKNPLDNLNVGLENGGTSAIFEGYYSDKLSGAKKLEKENKAKILLVKDYAEMFLSRKKIFSNSDNNYFLSKDYKSDDQSFWYHSVNFKAGIHKIGDSVYLIDLRNYKNQVDEDFSLLPNSQGYLRTTTPAIIDSMRFPDQKILLTKSSDSLRINKNGNSIDLFSGMKKIAKFNDSSLELFTDSNKSRVFDFSNKSSTFSTIVFDKKQLILYSIFSFIPISYFFIVFSATAIIVLLVLFYLLIIKSSTGWHKSLFFVLLIATILFYVRVPYFPLDKSTYIQIGSIFTLIALVFFITSFLIFKKIKSKKIFVLSILSIPIIILIFLAVAYLSRSSIVLTPFERDALKVIKEKNKDVIFISETDYNIKPIYKAVKPILYEDYHFGEKLTGTNWTIAVRPENNMIKLSDYKDKLVVAPRYLGADFSNHEAELHRFKKIFDNAQIAIFEKR